MTGDRETLPPPSGIRLALANADIRRILAGWAAGMAADSAFLTVALVVAYRAGGAIGVGLLGLFRMVPATVVALFASLERRWPAERTLVVINGVRLVAAAIGVATLATGHDLRVPVTFAVAGVIAGIGSLVRPTQSALFPAIAVEPAELVGANVAAGAGESAGIFVGPLLAGLLLATAGDAAAAGLAVVGFAVAVVAATGIRIEAAARPTALADRSAPPLVAGIRALRSRPTAAVVLVTLFTQVFVRGILTTLVVVAAIGPLKLGEPGVGSLNAAMGAGGVIGVVVALALAGRRRFAPIVAATLIGWGLPITVIGLVPLTPVAFAALAIIGLSNVVLDAFAYTLLQRVIAGRDRPAVFAVLEGGIGLGVTAGGLVAPALLAVGGINGALIVTGLILPAVAALAWRTIRRIDDEAMVSDEVATWLRADPLFRRLPLSALERIAAEASPVRFEVGEILMHEGEIGDRYFVITEGAVEATAAGRLLRRCGRGEGVGEIALLRAVPRTATVTALEPTTALAVSSASFIAAVTGHEAAGSAARNVVETRLAV